MDAGRPSRTALATAAARAAHLVIEHEPWIFEDRLAGVLLGEMAADLVDAHRDQANAVALASMRVAVTTRSRYSEERLGAAVGRGIRQYVVLGAGLDSFAYRSPLARGLCVFEVDHPATQAWKRERLTAAAIPVPGRVTFVAVDFRVDSLSDRLIEMGFDPSRPAFVAWLGVTQYLTEQAIDATLEVVGGFCEGTELAIEYLVPVEMRDADGQALADFFMPRAAAFGEPWLTFLTPTEIAGMLAARGMVVLDDVGRGAQIDTGLWERSDALRPHELGRLARAVVATDSTLRARSLTRESAWRRPVQPSQPGVAPPLHRQPLARVRWPSTKVPVLSRWTRPHRDLARLSVRQNAAAAPVAAGRDDALPASKSGRITADDRDAGSRCGRHAIVRELVVVRSDCRFACATSRADSRGRSSQQTPAR